MELEFEWDPEKEESNLRKHGVSSQGKMLVVSHTDREIKTRIINARRATPHERKDYEEG